MWKTITIPWGKEQKTFRLPQASIAWVISPKSLAAVPDEGAEIIRALRSPIGLPPLKDLVRNAKGKRTTILVDDGTRVTPVEKILPLLLDELNRAGVEDRQIKVIIALGTHRFMNSEEIGIRLGKSVDRVEAVNHAYNDPSQLVDLGATSQGTPIVVNRWYYESDISIGVSNIIPHFIAGWSGGAKIVQPGVSGEETTARTHINGSLTWPSILGNVENPIRHEMEEVARRSGLSMILNTVLNPKEEIVKLVAGDVVSAHREGVRHSKEIYQFRIKERPDIVIAGSYPANKDLWQADKALAAAVLMVKPSGIVILAAPCVEGICPEHPLLLELGARPAREVYAMAARGEFDDPIAAATHIKIGVMREMAKVTLVSQGVTHGETEQMGFNFADDLEAAIDRAFSVCGPSARVGVLTHGADSAPVIE
jgi:nickel-dependent lactate racemase